METLFALDKRNFHECQNVFRQVLNRDYYTGDYSIAPGSVVEVRADRRVVGAYSIVRLRSKTAQFFRRTWTHIREDGTDVAILCFVKRGWLRVAHQCGETIARPGDFIVTKSTTPFSVESHVGGDGGYELLHLTLPMHLLRSVLKEDVNTGFCISASSRNLGLAERILTDLFEDTGEISAEVAQTLLESVVSLMGEAIRGYDSLTSERQSLTDKRLDDIFRFIETHLSDAKLSVVAVAKGCGISPRYLSLLLRQNGTSFSSLIWEKRLEAAHQWLSAAKSDHNSISEVAYKVGFKSPAHFSRMFKRAFNLSPRQFRAAAHEAAQGLSPDAVVVHGGDSRH